MSQPISEWIRLKMEMEEEVNSFLPDDEVLEMSLPFEVSEVKVD